MQRRTRVTRITRAAGNKKPLARVVRKAYIYTEWVAGDLDLLLCPPLWSLRNRVRAQACCPELRRGEQDLDGGVQVARDTTGVPKAHA